MSKKVEPLGMNARNYLYIRPYNKKGPKRRADDKLITKRKLLKNNINTPDLVAAYSSEEGVREIDWDSLPKSFVIKPARGYGGHGILLIKKWDGQIGVTESGREYDRKDIESHIFDILSGAYSLGLLPDRAFIERRIIPLKFFKKIPILGIPDVRVIVFSGVPVMAMMRIPTEESEGKANLTKGAVGVGIDISTGVTTSAWQAGSMIRLFPGTRIKLRGIKVPAWDDVLEQAVQTQVVSKLGFAGIDIIIDKKHGPMVLEVNARPGLSIQLANNSSLKERLERVENITPKPSVERGIEIGKSLFTEEFSNKVKKGNKKEKIIIGFNEVVKVSSKNHKEDIELRAKIDTGAFRTSIDSELAAELGLELHDKKVVIRSASGTGSRDTMKISFKLQGKRISTIASVVQRDHMKYPMIVGRQDLDGFLVDPKISPISVRKIT